MKEILLTLAPKGLMFEQCNTILDYPDRESWLVGEPDIFEVIDTRTFKFRHQLSLDLCHYLLPTSF